MDNERCSDQQTQDLNRSAADDDEIDLLALIRTLWRGKWWIVFTALVAVLFGGVYAYGVAVPKYTANAVIVLESRQDTVISFDSVISGVSGDQASINTEVEVLRSRGLIEKLVQQMNLKDDPEFNATLQPAPRLSLSLLFGFIRDGEETDPEPSVQTILDNTVSAVLETVSISNIRQSYIFNISAVTTDPIKSAEMANTLSDIYILDQLEVKFEATEQATAWLSERVATLQLELEQAEAAVQELSASTKLVSAEALEAVNRQIKNTRERLGTVDAEVRLYTDRLNDLLAARASGDRDQMAAKANDAALTQILATNPADAAFEMRFDLVIQRVENDLNRSRAQAISLSQGVKTLEGDFAAQSNDLAALQQLQREAEASRLIYEYFLGRLKETSVQKGIQQADSRVLSRAAVPDIATSPRKGLILALSAVLGFMLGSGGILLREMQHAGFRTADELEAATGFAVMGQIPRIQTRGRTGVLTHLVEKPTSAAAEAVRNLRTSIVLSNIDEPPCVIMITSSVPGEGKTTASIALAQNFAGLGKKVLLIEGDIRRRVFSNYFELETTQGLLSVVTGEISFADAVQHSDFTNVDIIVAEKSAINPADVFSSVRFHDFVQTARDIYDVVIIDTPPVLVVPDARVLAQVSDAIMYAVAWDKTSRHQISEGLRQFKTGNIRVSGLILGQIDPKRMKQYGYGDRYGAYSSYGKGYYEA